MGIAYRLRVRTADNTSDLLVVTSVRGGTNPWIAEPPKGDGASIDPLTGVSTSGKYTIRIIDGITSGTSRIFTSLLTDSNGLPQLARLRAFIESSTDGFATSGCLIPGYLDTYQLSSDIVWDVTVIDAAALEHKILAFGPHYVSGQYESLKAYLARWPYRGCIFGGPIRTPVTDPAPRKFGQLLDRNGWTFDSPGGTTRELDFVSGYQSPGYQVTKKASDVADKVNTAAAPYFDPTASAVVQFSEFPPAPDGTPAYTGVVIQVGVAAGFTDGTPTDDEYYCATAVYSFDPSSRSNTAYMLVTPAVGGKNQILLTSALASRFVGQRVRARCFTALPSQASPIYWDGHPVDLITTLGQEAGFTYDSTSVEATRHALGDDLRLAIRVTAIQNLGDFLEAAVYGPFGIGTRSNAAGNIELYSTRIIESGAVGALPTITNADIVRGTAKPYQLDPSTAIKTVTFTAESWTFGSVSVGTDDSKYPADGVLVRPVTQQYVNGDVGAPETDVDQAYTIPGMPHRNAQWGINWSGPGKSDWASAAAAEIFDRWGRGIVESDVTGVHGGAADGLGLGDLAVVAIKQLPNENKRLVDDGTVPGRVMQVVFVDPTPNQTELHLFDGGPNAQPVTTLPTLTIAAVSSRVASITVTNAAALNTAKIAVRVRMAVTTGAAAASTAYADVAYFAAGQVPTGAVPLPSVTAGSKVFAIARSEHVGNRPSAYSTPVSVTLATMDHPVPSPPHLTFQGDGAKAQLVWALGANTTLDLIDIYLRDSAHTAAGSIYVTTLPAGSVQYTLDGLVPGDTYTASIQARDPITGDTSVLADITFTATGPVLTVGTPIDARGFSGRQNAVFGFPQQDGVYGLAVAAVEFPGFVEFWEAVETSAGSGAYGTAVTVATVPSVLHDWTLFEKVAPNDGLRRQLTAQHVRDGATSSAFTTAIVVTPWTALALAVFTNAVPTAVITLVSETSTTATLQLSGAGSGTVSYCVVQSNGATMPAFSTFISSPALPQTLVISRLNIRSVTVGLQTQQADGGLSVPAFYVVTMQMPSHDSVTGHPIRGFTLTDGGYAGHSTTSDGFTLHASVVDSRSSPVNTHFRYGVDGPGGVVESGTEAFVNPGYTDTSRRPTVLRDPVLVADVAANDINVGQQRARGGFTDILGSLVSTAKDSRASLVNTHFRANVDTAAVVVETGAESFVDPAYLTAGTRKPSILHTPDTRSVNGGPSSYGVGVTTEFKDESVIGIPGGVAGAFGSLRTEKPWIDSSGNNATQTFCGPDNRVWKRSEPAGNATWSGSWRILTESATQRFDRDSGHLDSTMQDSRASLVNTHGRLSVDTLDGWLDSSTRFAVSSVDVNKKALIDFAQTHTNKQLDVIADGASRYAAAQVGADAGGIQILSNPDFAGGSLAGYSVYDNNATGLITLSAVVDHAAPNSSGTVMQVSVAAGAAPSPGVGGFFVGIGPDAGAWAPDTYHEGATILWRVRAKIPIGSNIQWAQNASGTGSTTQWLTSQAGTGAYQDYLLKFIAGTTGSFSTIGFFYLDTIARPGSWTVASCTATTISAPPGIVNLAHPHAGKTLANIGDDSGSNRHAASSNQLTGGDRGFGGFTNAAGALVSTAQDSRASLVNTHGRLSVDTLDGWLDSSTRFAVVAVDVNKRPIIDLSQSHLNTLPASKVGNDAFGNPYVAVVVSSAAPTSSDLAAEGTLWIQL